MLRQRNFVPECGLTGTLTWTNTRTAARVGSIGFESQLDRESGRVRLHYTTTRQSGDTHQSDYWIQLETTPQPLGGRRWWFLCPKLGIRAATLYLPPGALLFASRKAHRLGYRSQRETPQDRALSRAFKLRHRIGADGGIGDPIAKPKGMRWVTFDREMDRICGAEAICDANLAAFARKLGLRV
ncbi:hypothetical protein MKK69_25315 [Methylobacterium sp. J-026]|uniref:hypothetical protein n=1 Tax=Methylobacterium sp. J-026 TaxID=2836624 RepID=UPI001FBA2719|nr:hypothetical protein [Methylobacterium sp. J-026]MCJ2137325.1 hypothetical protein [Methylobacterium sp. J-026]